MSMRRILAVSAWLLACFICHGRASYGATSISYLTVATPVDPGTSKISMVASFPGDVQMWTAYGVNRTFNTMYRAGVRVTNAYYSWGELETTKGVYLWNELDYILSVAKTNGLKTSIEIKIIDTNKVGRLPADVSFTSFDDAVMKARFKTFILALLQRYPGKISYLWIGNEIDDYLYSRRGLLDGYSRFYAEVRSAIKAKYPSVVVGTISTFHDAKNNNALDIIEKVGRYGDVIGFSYYPQVISGFTVAGVAVHFNEMAVIAGRINKKFAITESGFSTLGLGGSVTGQSQFLRELFRVYKLKRPAMEYLGLFTLYDFSAAMNTAIAGEYGLASNTEYLRFSGTIGLADNYGSAKQGYAVFLEEMNKVRY